MRKQKVNWFSNYSLVGSLTSVREGGRFCEFRDLGIRLPCFAPSQKQLDANDTQIGFAFPCSMHRIVLSYV